VGEKPECATYSNVVDVCVAIGLNLPFARCRYKQIPSIFCIQKRVVGGCGLSKMGDRIAEKEGIPKKACWAEGKGNNCMQWHKTL
jgi:hypothetical protein